MQQSPPHCAPPRDNDSRGRVITSGFSSIATVLSSWVLCISLAACNVDIPHPLTDVHIHVLADGSCAIEHEVVDCARLGAQLERQFPRHDCHILMDVDRRAAFEHVGEALRSIQSHSFANLEFSPEQPGTH